MHTIKRNEESNLEQKLPAPTSWDNGIKMEIVVFVYGVFNSLWPKIIMMLQASCLHYFDDFFMLETLLVLFISFSCYDFLSLFLLHLCHQVYLQYYNTIIWVYLFYIFIFFSFYVKCCIFFILIDTNPFYGCKIFLVFDHIVNYWFIFPSFCLVLCLISCYIYQSFLLIAFFILLLLACFL